MIMYACGGKDGVYALALLWLPNPFLLCFDFAIGSALRECGETATASREIIGFFQSSIVCLNSE